MQNQQGPGDKLTPKNTTDAFYFLAHCHSTCITPFIRFGFGCEGLAFNAVGAFIMLLLLWGADETGISKLYFWCWFMALLVQRMKTIGNQKKGLQMHSRYDGRPWLAMRFCKRESTAKRMIEPMLCLVIGAVLCPVSETIGAFVMAGAFSLTVIEGTKSWVDHIRVQKMRDAEIEMRRVRDLYRGVDNY